MEELLNPAAPAQAPEDLTNHCIVNQSSLTKALRMVYQTPANRAINVFYIALAAILLVCLGLCMYFQLRLSLKVECAALALLSVALLVYRVVFQPGVGARRQLRRSEEILGKREYETVTRFHDGRLYTRPENMQEETPLDYKHIKRVSEGKQHIVLQTKRGQLILLDRKGFLHGTERDFWHLMADHCPSAKIKRLG